MQYFVLCLGKAPVRLSVRSKGEERRRGGGGVLGIEGAAELPVSHLSVRAYIAGVDALQCTADAVTAPCTALTHLNNGALKQQHLFPFVYSV